jgi:glycosyltransferase involved in cell wall biosynthesis
MLFRILNSFNLSITDSGSLNTFNIFESIVMFLTKIRRFKRFFGSVFTMKIKIYTEHPVKLYYQAPYELVGDENIELIGSRFLYYVLINLNNRFKTFRKIRKVLTDKDNIIENEPVYPIWKSFKAPLRLLFSKNIILPLAACSSIVYYTLILKLLRKNLIYHTAWPYISEGKYVKKPRLFNEFLWKIFFKNLKAIGTSRKATESLSAMGCRAYNIPHSVNTDIFKPKENDELKVLYVGRLNEAKGIRSILKLAEKFRDVEFVFVGSGPLEDLLVGDNVEFLGEIKDREKLAEVYGDSEIFILNSYKTPEWEELFGRVLIEAMASGLAIISTDCIGPKEVINERNGILIEQRNDKQLFEKFKLLLEDKNLRESLGKEARKEALEKYSIKEVAKKWKVVIEK